MLKTIGTICVMLERKKYFASCEVLNNRKYDTWLKYFKNGRDKGASSYVQ